MPPNSRLLRPNKYWFIAPIGGIFLAFFLIIYLSIGTVIAYRLTHVPRTAIEHDPGALGLAFTETDFQSADGIKLSGWKIAGNKTNSPTVVFVHGIGVNRAQHHHMELAKHLSGQGISSMLFDLRGHGMSGGNLVSGGYFEQADVMAAVDQVPDASCRLVLGSSLGGAAAILAAEKLGDKIDGLIIDSTFADIKDLLAGEIAQTFPLTVTFARALIPGASLMARLIYDINLSQLIPARAISQLPYPVLIIHGKQDERITFAQAINLYAAAPEGSKLLAIEKAGHTESYSASPSEYLAAIDDYIKSACHK